MKVAALYSQPDPTISFEFFPLKTDVAEDRLFREALPELQKLNPAFTSVTYGAGGGTRDRTFRIVDRIRKQHGLESMAHLTCVGNTRAMIADTLDEAQSLGIENILALRGDLPSGETEFVPPSDGFAHAVDLVEFIRARYGFGIAVAGFPEGHIENPDKYTDWKYTAEKVHAGAEVIITQLFYDADDFCRFEDYLREKCNVTVPIVPGLLPFLSAGQIKRFTDLCGARLPTHISHRIEQLAQDDESVRCYGVEVCTDICRRLLDRGVPGFHFYCLNKAQSCTEILKNLKLA